MSETGETKTPDRPERPAPVLKVIPAAWAERPEFRAWMRELRAAFAAYLREHPTPSTPEKGSGEHD